MDCTLLCDGSSDRMLIPCLKWLLVENYPNLPFNFEYAEIRQISNNNHKSLKAKICLALEYYPCDILFVQRDTEKKTYEIRLNEIKNSIIKAECAIPRIIPVIPKRMSEAWLFINESAIRQAAGNINGTIKLKLPPISKLESMPDPKSKLIELLKKATELNKRRLSNFNPYAAIHRLAETIDDYSLLRKLYAFQALESEIKNLKLK